MTTSDSITKSELIEQFENIKDKNGFELRVFPEGSNDDQVLYEDGGCTFAYKGKTYGSCDGVLFSVFEAGQAFTITRLLLNLLRLRERMFV